MWRSKGNTFLCQTNFQKQNKCYNIHALAKSLKGAFCQYYLSFLSWKVVKNEMLSQLGNAAIKTDFEPM